jgi:hypothetical protein
MSAPCCPYATAATWITALLGIAGIILTVVLVARSGEPTSRQPGATQPPAAVPSQ